MTVAHVYTVAFQGIEAREVDVQVHIGDSGSGQFNVVGLADKAVGESRERVRAALAAFGQNAPTMCGPTTLSPTAPMTERHSGCFALSMSSQAKRLPSAWPGL